MRVHQLVEIEPLDRRELGLHARDIVEARGLDGVTQRAAALGLEVLIEIGDRRARRIGCRFVRQPHGDGLCTRNAAAGHEQIERALRPDQFRQQAGRGGSEHAELQLRLSESRIGRDEQKMARKRDFEPAAETLSANRNQDGNRRFHHAQDQAVNVAKHRRALRRQVLFDTGPEAEMRTFRIEHDGTHTRICQMFGQRLVQRRNHRGIDQICFRPAQ